MDRLDGKVALITGGGRGIGREIALKLGSEGARIVVNDLDPEPAEEVVQTIRANGGEAVACVGSVTAPDFAERFVGMATETYQGLDIIVNNAGYTWDAVIQRMTDEQWYAMMDVHLTAPFRILRVAQPVIKALHKLESDSGDEVFRKVVNISSIAGLDGNAAQANYATAKAGIVGMTRTLAKEWGRYKVNVNCVAFGIIQTRLTAPGTAGGGISVEGRSIKVGMSKELMEISEKMIPLGRSGTPQEAAGAVFLFCLPESNYLSGQTLVCSGGLRL